MIADSVLPALKELMERQREKADQIEKATGKEVVHVFNRNGQPVKSFKAAWKKAVEKAGFDDRIFHDFRRTAVRNLIRAGVSEHVAMMITGHKTRSIFDRYDIVSERDLTEGIEKLAKFHGQEPTQPEPPKEEPIMEEKKVAVGGGGVVISFPGRR
jgi:integrase